MTGVAGSGTTGGTTNGRRLHDILPLSPLQEGLLFWAQLTGGGPEVYNVSTVLTLDGPLDPAALRAAARALLERHPNLRAGFRYSSAGRAVALVPAAVDPPWREVDLRGPDAERREQEAARLRTEEANRPFAPARPPLLRFALLRLADERHQLVLTNHHILLDGWSMPLLVRELFALYRHHAGTRDGHGPEPAVPRARPFRDYLTWLAAADRPAAEAAWAAALDGLEGPTRLAPGEGPFAGEPGLRVLEVPGPLAAGLAELARARGLTLNTVVAGAWGLLLARLLGREDVVFGTTVSGRPADLPGSAEMLGLFINTVPVRVRVRPGEPVARLLARLQREQADLMPHQHLGLATIQRLAGMGELFDTLAVFENYPFDDAGIAEPAPGLRLSGVGGSDATHYPLTLTAVPGQGPGRCLRLELGYRPDAFAPAEVDAIGARLRALLEDLLADPDRPVGRVGALTAPERAAALAAARGPQRDLPAVLLPDVLAERAALTPAMTALVAGDTRLSFADVDGAATRLARALVARGVGPERVVALAVPRTHECVVAVLAVLRAGGAFLPLDADLPAGRIAFLLEDAAPALVVTTAALAGTLPPYGCPRLVLDDPKVLAELVEHAAGPVTDADRIAPLRPGNAAYVLYTSGSTGRPKGVVVAHSSLANLYADHRDALFLPEARRAGRRLRVALTAALSFDTSWEGLLAMVAGHELHVVDADTRLDADEVVDYVARERVDLLDLTPSFAQQLFAAGLLAAPAPRVVLLGGEAAGDAVWSRLRAAPDTVGYNYYGPTECTVDTLSCRLSDSARPVVGRPLTNTSAYVLDGALAPVLAGVPGELYLAGAPLGRGYLDRPALTAERFVADPYGPPGTRMYRSGDVARRLPDGTLDFIGRADGQVKIRGFRIEPGEVEAALLTHPAVAQAAVVARTAGPDAPARLVAYVVPAADGPAPDPAGLRAHVAAALPDHMVPAAVVALEALPLTSSGKLDHRALPVPDLGGLAAGRAPRTAAERALADAYAAVLGLPQVGADADFFVLGGDSISSMQLVSRARAAGLRIRPRDVFRARTVAALAALAEEITGAEEPAEEPGERLGPLPLTPLMSELIAAAGPDVSVHQSMLLRTPPDLREDAVRAAVAGLVSTHEVLRARLERGADGGWVLEVPPASGADAGLLRRVDAAGVTGARLRRLLAAHTAAAVAALAPAEGAMLRAVWFDAGPAAEGRLLLVAHHLVVDGVSWRILVGDLAAACAPAGEPRPAPERSTSFRRWARLLAARAADPGLAAELPRWRAALAGADPALGPRPLDPARDTLDTAGLVTLDLSAEETAPLLADVPNTFRAGVEDVLLTALALAVARWRDASALLVDLEGHGREEAFVGAPVDLSRTVGWFTSRYPVRLDLGGLDVEAALAGAPVAGRALQRVKEELRSVPGGGLGYGLLRHAAPKAFDGAAVPQVEFNYLGRFGAADGAPADSGPFTAAPEQEMLGGGTAAGGCAPPLTHVLTVNVMVRDGAGGPRLSAHWSFAGGLLAEADVRALAAGWVAALAALARHAAAPGAGGRTPSDLPLVRLTQDQIDVLERAEPGLVDVWPVTPLQAGLLFHTLASTGVDVYTVQDVVSLTGPLDTALLRRCAAEMLRRHPGLRAGFHHVGQDFVAVVPPPAGADAVAVPWREVDLAPGVGSGPGPWAAERLAAEERDARFDPAHPPLLRFLVLRLGPERYRIVFTCHHLLLDGWATQLFAAELFALYRAGADPAALPAPVPYPAYLAWLAAQDADAARQAWGRALAGLEQATLVADAGPRGGSGQRTEVVARLSGVTGAALAEVARGHGVTLNTVVQAAWGLALAQLTGRDDVVFGQTVSGRSPEVPGVEAMIGLLINTVPVRVRLRAAESLGALLVRLQDEQANLMAHHHLGLVDVQRAAGMARLFDTLVVFESYPVDEASRTEPAPGLRVTATQGVDATHYPLTLAVQPGPEPALHLEYHPDCFDGAEAGTILDALVALLAAFAEDPARPVAAAVALAPDLRRRILTEWHGPDLPVPGVTLPALFARAAGRTPYAPAVVCGTTTLTFAELDALANRLAHALTARGVGPERVVALLLPRGVDTVVALLGVLKAGGAYLPLDPAYPAERIARTLADAGAVLVLTAPGAGPPPGELPALVLDDALLAGLPDTEPATLAHLTPDHPAYVIYTSGSTGEPKGVVVSHRSVVNLFHSHRETLYRPTVAAAGGRALRVGHTWSFAFDASWQPQLWLLDGHTLHVVTEETMRDPDLLVSLIRAERLDFVEVSPTLGAALAAAGLFAGRPDGRGSPLLALGVGGEAVPAGFWDRMRALPGTECFNLYGPTEATVDALAARVRDSQAPLVGRPTANTRAYVLDFRLAPVGPGVPGELHLAGAGLARGYLGRPAQTAERFVADPYGPPGSRMYRTGDLMRWTSDGALDYLGRADAQVKIRGFRVEPGEIAAVLAEHPAVSRAVVGVWSPAPGDDRLVAHVVPAADAEGPGVPPDFRALRAYLASRLPDHMVPAAYVEVAAIPLTAHGKVDRAALPPPGGGPAAAGRPPADAAEALLCAAFADVLGVGEVGPDDNFFDLGGHSLSLVALRGRIAAATGCTLPIAALFGVPTPAGVHGLLHASGPPPIKEPCP